MVTCSWRDDSLAAGERALRSFGYEEAVTHFELAKNAVGTERDDSTMAAIYFGLGRARLGTIGLRGDTSFISLQQAFELFVKAGNFDKAIEVAMQPTLGAPGDLTEHKKYLSRALSLVAPGSLENGTLLVRYGHLFLMHATELVTAVDAANQALEIAREKRDPELELEAWRLQSRIGCRDQTFKR